MFLRRRGSFGSRINVYSSPNGLHSTQIEVCLCVCSYVHFCVPFYFVMPQGIKTVILQLVGKPSALIPTQNRTSTNHSKAVCHTEQLVNQKINKIYYFYIRFGSRHQPSGPRSIYKKWLRRFYVAIQLAQYQHKILAEN